MGAVNEDIACEIARKEIERLASIAGDSFEILPEETKYIGVGWIFFFNSSEYVRNRNPMDALAGNGPLVVLDNGQIRHLPSSVPWQDALKHI